MESMCRDKNYNVDDIICDRIIDSTLDFFFGFILPVSTSK